METIRKIEAFVSRADEISAAEEDVPRVCMEISRLIGDLMAFEDEVPDFDGVSESDFLSEVHIKFLNLMKIVERVREEVRLVIGLNAEKFNPGRRELFKAMAKGLGKDRPPWAWKKDAGLEFSCSLVIFENLRDVLKDVESFFSIRFWEHDNPQPYAKIGLDEFREHVASGEVREFVPDSGSLMLKNYIFDNWRFDEGVLFDIADVLAEEADTTKKPLTVPEIADFLGVEPGKITSSMMMELRDMLSKIDKRLELIIHQAEEEDLHSYEIAFS